MMLRPGTFLQDRYEILEQIGSGGMSVVYKAKCHKLNRFVAIKVLKEEFCDDSNFVSKFKMEAQAAAGLSHPNIVSVYDVIDEGQLHYIVMELIEGITLKSYIAKKGHLEVKETIGIAIQVAQGMEAAHEQHIIHRDIKPQNIMISRDGKVKVTDFGIARAVTAQTMTSSAMGSVHYISPEQAKGRFCDERSDIYSLGITIYEMVTGYLPFDGENAVAIAVAHLSNETVRPSVYNPEVPQSLERIILKCMEKRPEQRYASASELIMDLRKALLQPDGHFVKDSTSAALDGETIQLGDKEVQEINERSREIEQKDFDRDRERSPKRYSHKYSAGEENYDTHRKNRNENRNEEVVGEEDEVNPKLERLLAGVGIVVAIGIVAVLIVVVMKLFGGFSHAGLGNIHTTAALDEAQMETTTESAQLKDTEVYMPDVRGLTEEEAQTKLKASFLTMKVSYTSSDEVKQGYVISQAPSADSVVLKGASVNVIVSTGSGKLVLSELKIGDQKLTDLDVSTAKTYLESKNLSVTVVEQESDTVEKDQVIRYEPEEVEENGSVVLYVSSGPHVETAYVPSLTGKTKDEANALLTEAGLLAGDVTEQSSESVASGHVISQSKSAGTQLEVGSKIDYVVSTGPQIKRQRYVASINEVYDPSNLIGPGASGSTVSVMVRLRQGPDSNPLYKVLMQTTRIKGNVLLPISFTSIESMDGTDQGQVEVINVDSGEILKIYPLTFFAMD